jgi:hypothetical protein
VCVDKRNYVEADCQAPKFLLLVARRYMLGYKSHVARAQRQIYKLHGIDKAA